MGKTTRTLAGVTLLEGLDESERKGLEAQCAWRRYRLGEKIFERGGEDRDVYFVIEGGVNIINFSSTGREVSFRAARAGDTFGEMAAIDGEPRSASVVSTEDTILGILPEAAFVGLLERRAEVTFRLLKRLSRAVRKGTEQVMELSTMEATTRVYADLLRRARPDDAVPDLWIIDPLPPLHEIARCASTSRDAVTGALNQLYPAGLLRREGESLYIMDRSALERIVSAASPEQR